MCETINYFILGWAIMITLMYIILAIQYNNTREYPKRIRQLENDIGLKNSLLLMYERRRDLHNESEER